MRRKDLIIYKKLYRLDRLFSKVTPTNLHLFTKMYQHLLLQFLYLDEHDQKTPIILEHLFDYFCQLSNAFFVQFPNVKLNFSNDTLNFVEFSF